MTWRTSRRFTATSSATCGPGPASCAPWRSPRATRCSRCPAHIGPYLSDVLAGLPRENYLRGLPAGRLADRLTHYLAEINAVHPFREGNGRTATGVCRPARRPGRLPPGLGAADPERGTSRRPSRRCAATWRRCDRPSASSMSPAARGGRDPRAASFPAPAAYATRRTATQRNRGAPRGPGASRASSAKQLGRSRRHWWPGAAPAPLPRVAALAGCRGEGIPARTRRGLPSKRRA